MRKWLLIAVLVVVPYVPLAEAGFQNGNSLLADCRNKTDIAGQASCRAYIAAITDVLHAKDAVQGFRACLSTDVTQGQVRDVVMCLSPRQVGEGRSAALLARKIVARAADSGVSGFTDAMSAFRPVTSAVPPGADAPGTVCDFRR